MYASVLDVRAAGAAGAATDAAITGALGQAKERIDRYTGDSFETETLTVRALLSGGLAPLPLRVQAVTGVRYADTPDVAFLGLSAFYVRTSKTRGDVDAIQLVGYGLLGSGLLDITYEPVRSAGCDQDVPILVDGTFGWDVTPDAVRDAAVELALLQLTDPGAGTVDVNAEGDADLGIAPTVPLLGRESAATGGSRGTTGSPLADSLLVPYVRSRVRIT